jgi:hypothetical protein
MNFFKALFGGRRSAEPPPPAASAPAPASTPAAPSHSSYIARRIKAVQKSESVAELAEYASDYSGYVRQAAMERCAILARPELLPAIVGRLNDWVQQVSEVARATTLAVMPFVSAQQLLKTLPAIQHLHASGRSDHAHWIGLFEHELIRLVGAVEIVAGARGSDIKVARACFRVLKNYHLLAPAALLSMILEAGNDIVLATEGVHLIAQLPQEQQRPHYLLALRSHFGPVRAIAMRGVLGSQDPTNVELARGALLNTQASVRDAAAAFMRSTGFDLAQFYRDVLQQSQLPVKTVQVALASLASLRDAEDVVLVRLFVSDPRISVRRAALAGWLKLSAGDKDDIASVALMDGASTVRKFALDAVRRHGAYIPFASVRSRLEDIGDLALLLLFARSRVWDGLECIVSAALRDPSDLERQQLLIAALRDWVFRFGQRYEIPSVEQRTYLVSPMATQAIRNLVGDNAHLMRCLEAALAHEFRTPG